MAFPSTSVLDDFNRANGGYGSNWSLVNGGNAPQIVSNTASFPSFGGETYWSAASYSADQEVFCSISTELAVNGYHWLLARIQSPGSGSWDGYKIERNKLAGTDTLTVSRIINDASETTGLSGNTANVEFSAGDRFGVKVTGTGATVTIEVYQYTGGAWNQTPVLTCTDTHANRIVAGGYIGMGSFEGTGTVRVDDFGGGDVAGGGGDPGESDPDTFVRVGGAWVAQDRQTHVGGVWV